MTIGEDHKRHRYVSTAIHPEFGAFQSLYPFLCSRKVMLPGFGAPEVRAFMSLFANYSARVSGIRSLCNFSSI